MNTVLKPSFFNRDTVTVARELLGMYLVTGDHSFMITETEAYIGSQDLACHASKGKTDRTAPMFGKPGHWYVYLIYGMYWMLNIVTEREGHPAAVLIRAVADYNGPGKLTKFMKIDKRYNKTPAVKNAGLWIEDRGMKISQKNINVTPRIGVDYAGEWAAKPFRFVLV